MTGPSSSTSGHPRMTPSTTQAALSVTILDATTHELQASITGPAAEIGRILEAHL